MTKDQLEVLEEFNHNILFLVEEIISLRNTITDMGYAGDALESQISDLKEELKDRQMELPL